MASIEWQKGWVQISKAIRLWPPRFIVDVSRERLLECIGEFL